MERRKSTDMNYLRIFLIVMIFVGACYFLFGERFLPSDNVNGKTKCEELQAEWTRIEENGEITPVKSRTKFDVEKNEPVTVETVLPDGLENNMYLRFYSMRQDMWIYIDGELRKEYSTENTRLFGKTSSAAYVFVEINSSDSGKKLTVVSQSDSSYSGVIRTVYIGDLLGFWSMTFKECGAEVLAAFLMLILSAMSIIISMVMRFCYHKPTNLEHLGWGVLIAATWLLTNSKFRQLLFPNLSVASDITFFCIMLLPIPFLLYLNVVQNGRYYKYYTIVGVIAVVDVILCTLLQIMRLKDFAETIFFMEIICLSVILFMGITIVIDIFRGYIKEYQLIAIGILGAFLSAVAQMILYLYKIEISFNGIMMALGLMFLLVIALISTIRDVLRIEQEKMQAIYASESKARFLASMSHEIRTPINAVLGMDEIILNECTQDNIREYATDIKSAGKTLLSLVNDILDFSKIESGKMEIIPGEYEISSLISDCYNMVNMRAKEKNLKLTIKNDKTLPKRLLGDEVRIRQIIINLLNNAVKYTNEGEVTLSVSGKIFENDTVLLCVSVADTGIGIAQENLDKLFESFQRVEEAHNRNIEGTGLGLAIAKQLVELMDGNIHVKSTYGEGSVFTVEIPQKIVSLEPVGDISLRYMDKESEDDVNKRIKVSCGRILVVDDVAVNLKVVKGLLKDTGLQIDTAESGMECLAMLSGNEYDIIFLDHMMPEMDGIETLNCIKKLKDNNNSAKPVIMLTANALQGAKEEYLANGFSDYLSKPIRLRELEEIICKYLPREFFEDEEQEKNEDHSDETFLEKLNFLDTAVGLECCADSEELYLDILKTYVEAYGQDNLQQSFEQEDWENYHIQIHGAKSASRSIGALQLSEQAKELEMAVKREDYEYVRLHHDEFMKAYGELVARIEGVITK